MENELTFTDIFNKTIKLEEHWIILSKPEDKRGASYKYCIPYSSVIRINKQNGSFFNMGFFSLITMYSGLTYTYSYLSPEEMGKVFEDEGTLLFDKADKEIVSKIIDTINSKKLSEPEVISKNADDLNGYQFEDFCAELLKKNGFKEVITTPKSCDQGVDILAKKESVKYAFQCKHYSSPLGNKPVQEINAGKTFYKCHVGVVMTNSTFTPSAVALADATGVLLWDGTVIATMQKNCIKQDKM